MGFNNDGVVVAIDHLKKARENGVIVGGNIGKNKITPNEQTTDDYLVVFKNFLILLIILWLMFLLPIHLIFERCKNANHWRNCFPL